MRFIILANRKPCRCIPIDKKEQYVMETTVMRILFFCPPPQNKATPPKKGNIDRLEHKQIANALHTKYHSPSKKSRTMGN